MARTSSKDSRESRDRDRDRDFRKTGKLRRACYFCREKIDHVDYKEHEVLRRQLSERGKIRSRRVSGTCRRHQVQFTKAVKLARELALLPYVDR